MILNMVMAEEDIASGIDGYVKLTLMCGCDDYVMAAEIVDNIFNIDECFKKYIDPRILAIVNKTKSINEKIMKFEIARDLTIAIINNVLTNGFMEIGDLEDGFKKWPLDSKGAIWLGTVNKLSLHLLLAIRMNAIVPLAMEIILHEMDRCKFLIADFLA